MDEIMFANPPRRPSEPSREHLDVRQVLLPSAGVYAMVSAEDFDLVSTHRWWLQSMGYAAAHPLDNPRETLLMHRLILGAVAGQIIDHRDGNKLNNTRQNLRFCTSSQNGSNARAPKNKKHSRFKGVTLHVDKRTGWTSWRVQISPNRTARTVGYFKCEVEAALAYDRAAREVYGDFALTNFPVTEGSE